MKISTTTKPIRVALAESDPMCLVGFRALLESESDLETDFCLAPGNRASGEH